MATLTATDLDSKKSFDIVFDPKTDDTIQISIGPSGGAHIASETFEVAKLLDTTHLTVKGPITIGFVQPRDEYIVRVVDGGKRYKLDIPSEQLQEALNQKVDCPAESA